MKNPFKSKLPTHGIKSQRTDDPIANRIMNDRLKKVTEDKEDEDTEDDSKNESGEEGSEQKN